MKPESAGVDYGLGVCELAPTAEARRHAVPLARPAMPGPAVATPAHAALVPLGAAPYEEASAALCYASFGSRVAAAVIDFVILQVVSTFLDSLFLGAMLSSLNATTILMATLGPLLIEGVFATFYCVWLESSPWQATPGKRIMGLKVVDLCGRRIGFCASARRNFAKALSVLTFGVGYLMPLWSYRRQALHDRVAGCLIVRTR